MNQSRSKKAKLNIGSSLLCQFVMLISGFILPRLLLKNYGSEAYGATTSITHFLAYISLLEGGIAGVARAALYKPLADHDDASMSAVIHEIKRFFRVIAYIFLIYVVVLACLYKGISNIEYFDWLSSFLLVVVMSMSTFAQYFIGISYAVLLQADQKTYITQSLSIITTILNMIAVIFLVNIGCNLIVVKFVSGLIFVLKPIYMWVYVKKNYNVISVKEKHTELLKQKWTGLGQHIAYFLHSNTDVVVLTVLADLRTVAVYSVYYMVTYHIQSITTSFSAGMEALFGDMLAKDEIKELHKTFSFYETMISFVTVILFGTTAALLTPFIRLYTSGVHDADYIQPVFGLLLVIASTIYCLRLPYHAMTIAAGHFKETRLAAYGEAGLNILLSIVLVIRHGLIGVAIGTVIATGFRFIYYAVYLTNHIFNRPLKLFVKRLLLNSIAFGVIFVSGYYFTEWHFANDYLKWVINGVVIVAFAIICMLLVSLIFFKDDTVRLIRRFIPKLHRSKL